MPPYPTFNNVEMRNSDSIRTGQLNPVANTECVTFSFKLARTCDTKYYNIPTNWSVNTMLLNLQDWAIRDFVQLQSASRSDIEVVIGGQYIQGLHAAEDAPSLNSENITVKQKFCNVYGDTHFYLRRREQVEVVLDEEVTCPICFQVTELNSYFQCAHGMCAECNNGCLNTGHHSCPECRRARL